MDRNLIGTLLKRRNLNRQKCTEAAGHVKTGLDAATSPEAQ